MASGVDALRLLGITGLAGRWLPGIRYRDAINPSLVADGDFHDAPAFGVRRPILHEALALRASELGVTIRRERVASLANETDGVSVNDVKARWLVGADGLHSFVRRSLELERAPRRRARLGLRRHVRIAPWCERVEVHFAEDVEAYVTPVADDLVGIAFLFEKERIAASWDVLLARFPLLARRIANAMPASALRGAGPFERRVRRPIAKSTLLVGDAAGYLDPLTGEGVAIGIESALLAVECIARGKTESYARRHAALVRRANLMTSLLLRAASHETSKRALLLAARKLPALFDAALSSLARGSVMIEGCAHP